MNDLLARPEPRVRFDVEWPPGAFPLVGSPDRPGRPPKYNYVALAGFRTRDEAVEALLRRALSVTAVAR